LGVAISKLLQGKPLEISELAHKTLAVDAYNMLYQFLTTIRMRDGTPLKNSKGQATSHLVGLFSRTTNLLEHGIKLVFVFDGKTPLLKGAERDRRRALKEEATRLHQQAITDEDVEGMRKYAGRTAVLTSAMVAEAKELLEALGIPWVQAPAEAEAQAALMVRREDAYAVASQDLDALLFGAPRMVKNLSITGKRRRPSSNIYYNINPELITLAAELEQLGLSQDQLIALGMLVGTDFNPGGVKGLGPKKSLTLVKEHQEDFEALFKSANWAEHNELEWTTIYDVIKQMPVTEDYSIEFANPQPEKLHSLLVDRFEFSNERVENALERLRSSRTQKGLSDFF
jgi:flap endonuclease-1